MRTDSDLMTASEVAAEFGVTVATVGRWADRGRLFYIKTLGGHRRYRRAEVERLAREADDGATDPR